MTRPLITPLAALLLLMPACNAPPEPGAPSQPAAQATAGCARDAMASLISAPEDVPTRDDVERACTDPRSTLIALAEDASGLGLTRLRAIDLLGDFSSERVVSTLSRLARSERDLASVRRSALVALGRATQLGDATRVEVAKAALADPDPHVRAAAQKLLSE